MQINAFKLFLNWCYCVCQKSAKVCLKNVKKYNFSYLSESVQIPENPTFKKKIQHKSPQPNTKSFYNSRFMISALKLF